MPSARSREISDVRVSDLSSANRIYPLPSADTPSPTTARLYHPAVLLTPPFTPTPKCSDLQMIFSILPFGPFDRSSVYKIRKPTYKSRFVWKIDLFQFDCVCCQASIGTFDSEREKICRALLGIIVPTIPKVRPNAKLRFSIGVVWNS